MADPTDREMLSDVKKRIRAILRTGQEYVIQGSRSIKNPTLKELRDLQSFYETRLLRASGATGKNLPDFSQGSGRSGRTLEDFGDE